ncbi:AraC family transcriptional regulator [Shewanella sp. UCD-KL12]|uniref:AraC family transcriptional regulator n=1 Tax=Shewanella sp. UCD-KL12 TaxID=1917163 RepID=UPI0009703ED2|nr:AraC family transcriptional regulator [Shewanella sp. UCD-KL12]
MKQYKSDSVRVQDIIWFGLERLSISKQDIAAKTHLPASILLSHQAATVEQYFSIWEVLPDLANDISIGVKFSQKLETAQLPPSYYNAYLAKNYRDAIYRVARFKRLCAPEAMLIRDGTDITSITIEWLNTDKSIPDALVDATFGSLLELGIKGTKTNIRAESLELTRDKPETSYLEEYFGCDIRYGSQKNSITFRNSNLDLEFETYNRELSNMILPQLENELKAERNKGSFSGQVKWVIERNLSAGSPTVNFIAKELGVSTRTLQRRITEEGKTYKDLLLQVRRQTAKSYLLDTEMSLYEIAVLLGYEDQNSFYRAFKLWEGETPSNWRMSNHSQSGSLH